MAETEELRVMIADDDQEMRRSTRLMMTYVENARVVAIAQDGREALELARQHHPDVALMDVNMPQLDGLSAIEVLMRENPEMVCIVISAERQTATLQEAMRVGARGYLIKPFTVDQLQAALDHARRLLQQQNERRRQAELDRQREQLRYLEQLAGEYARARRTDQQALEVFETLAAYPDCQPRWLMVLAMMYVVRKEWGKLKALAERLEKLQSAHAGR